MKKSKAAKMLKKMQKINKRSYTLQEYLAAAFENRTTPDLLKIWKGEDGFLYYKTRQPALINEMLQYKSPAQVLHTIFMSLEMNTAKPSKYMEWKLELLNNMNGKPVEVRGLITKECVNGITDENEDDIEQLNKNRDSGWVHYLHDDDILSTQIANGETIKLAPVGSLPIYSDVS